MVQYYDKYIKDFKNLCTPAFFYLAISVLAFVVIAVQNFGNTNKYCLGSYECNVPNTFIMCVSKLPKLKSRDFSKKTKLIMLFTLPACYYQTFRKNTS